jgi:hypothetical protein
LQELKMVVSTEWRTACHQLIQNGSHTPQICLSMRLQRKLHNNTLKVTVLSVQVKQKQTQ